MSELLPGDLLEVKIQGGVGAGGMIQNYLSSTQQEAVFPVEKVERKGDDKTYIFLEINDEIKGLLTVTKDLRLKTLKRNPKKSYTVNLDTLIFFGILGISFIVILLVANYFFF